MPARRSSQVMYDAERARIARMIRDSEAGWLFYPPGRGGRALSVSEAEAERIEGILIRQLDRFAVQLDRLQGRILAVGLIAGFWLMTVHIVAPVFSGLALAILTPALLTYTLWEGTLDLRFRIARRRWCREQAERIEHRMPIPDEIEAHHRRFNLFHAAACAFTLGGVARMLWRVHGGGDLAAALDPAALALVAAGCLLMVPARRVDATHRRRRWAA